MAGLSKLVLWLALAAAAMALANAALPKFAAPLAAYFPAAWEKRLARETLYPLIAAKKECPGIKALQTLAEKLAPPELSYTITIIKEKSPRAFTVPGGNIVFSSGLLASLKNENELAGVLAHEMGHVMKHHPTQSLIRDEGLALWLHLALGSDLPQPSGADTLIENRAFETEADDMAAHILYNAGVDNRGFRSFLLRSGGKESKDDFHPVPAERIAALEAQKNATGGAPLFTPQEWYALQHICN